MERTENGFDVFGMLTRRGQNACQGLIDDSCRTTRLENEGIGFGV
jgi:hypothetical protein